MRSPILTNPFRLPASVPMPFSCLRTIGEAFRRHSISSRFPVCATLSARAWQNRSTNPPPNPVGELDYRLHAASSEGRQKTGVLKPQATGATSSRDHREEPFPKSPAIRKSRRRFGRSLLPPHQHPTPLGVSADKGTGQLSALECDATRHLTTRTLSRTLWA